MKTSKKPFLSIIVPIFNEQKRVKNLTNVISYFRKQKYSWEVIVVDDGSTDETIKVLKLMKKKLRFKLLTYSPNLGKGFAVKTGMLSAQGKYRLFIDLDLSTPIAELEKFLPYFKKYDIIIGSRKLKSSTLLKRQPIIREYLGKVFTLLSQFMLNTIVSDFTCGFKIFSQKAAEHIFTKQRINRWGFDSEILYIGNIKKFSIKEVPVVWNDDPRTKVKFPQDIINSLIELLTIRVNSFKNLYR